MLKNIENQSTLYEVIVNNTIKIGNVRIYKGTFYNLRNNDAMARHYFRRKTVIRKYVFNRIVRV